METSRLSVISPTWKDFLVNLRLEPDAVQGGFGLRTARNPKRVLIVEDNIDSARSTTYLVNDMGHKAEYAINGYAALTIAKTFKPDVVLLDLGLPGLNGFDVCRRLKKDPDLAHVRVIAITGYAADEYRTQSEAAGCDMHFVKPISPKLLEELLDWGASGPP